MKKAAPAKEKKRKYRPVSPKALRVLIVEDNEDDAELIIRELKKGGYNPEYQRVETAAEMKKALKGGQWDIVLCDYALPKFTAPQAIRLLRETNQDIPIIIVSGVIAEETAADCMILGAQDFIRKSNLSRLYPAVKRELQEAKTRRRKNQAEEALRRSQNFLAGVFDSIQDGISILDTKMNIIGVNSAHEKWYKQSAPLLGKKCYRAYHGRNKPCKACPSLKTLKTGKPAFEIVSKEGPQGEKEGWLEVYSFPMQDESTKKINGVIEYVRDITERKRVELELQKERGFSQTLVEHSPAFFVAIDSAGKTIMMNKTFLAALGYTEKEVTRKDYLATFVPKSERKSLTKVFAHLTKDKQPSVNENHVLTKKGEQILVEWHGRPVFKDNGELDYFFGVGINITERHKAQEELKQSEEKYRSILSSIQEGYFEVDTGGTYTFVNDANCRLLGYTRDELIGMNYRQHMDKETAEKIRKTYTALYQTGKPIQSLEVDSFKKDGTKVTYETSVSLIKDAGGKPIGFRGISRDITERKQAEATLKRSEEKYRSILENIEDGYYETDLSGNLTFFNDSACRISGYSPEESMGMNFRQYTPEKDADKIYSIFHEVYKTGIPVKGLSYELIRKDKTSRHVETSVSLRRNATNKITGFQGIMRDITDRKLAEEKLRESEEKYRNLVERANDGIAIIQDGVICYANPQLLKIVGYPEEELIGYPFHNFITQNEVPKIIARYTQRMAGKDVASIYETTLKHKNGKIINVEFNAGIITYHGKVADLAFVRDITTRKQAEEALRESEEKYRNILETMQEGYYEVDLSGNTIFVNDAMCRIQGYSKEELLGMNNRQYTDPETAKKVYQEFNEVYRTEKPGKTSEHEIIRKDGSKIWIEASIALRRDAAGKKIGFKGIVRDITERKQAEEELRRKHEEMETMIESSPIMVFFKDTQNRFLRVNKALLETTNLTKEEIEGKSNEEINPRRAAENLAEDQEIIATGVPKTGILETVKTRKGIKVLRTDKAPYKDAQGNIVGIVGFSVDITEQKKAQDALRESEEKYRSLVENAQEGIYQSTPDGHYITVNQAFARILGYSCPQEMTQSVTDISGQLYVHPSERERLIKRADKYGEISDFETEFYRKDGSRIWLSVSMHAVRDGQGNLLYYQGMVQDFTEKKKMAAERQENIKKLRNALGATINAMAVTVETRDPYTAGHQRRVADLARAIATQMRLSSDQIDGVRMASMIHDIGKISIPSEILTKPTQLSELEYNLIKTHPSSGHAILKDIEFPWPIARIVLEHHE
ncbi:MAG TPA: PAS domain S-box protein, partial [Deltaproteobacteria bacterium]|nr:PAS domain S-box protein [Deltaproteobacteria bacterium]